MKHGNLSESGFPKGCSGLSSKLFVKSLREFQNEFPKGLKLLETGLETP